MEPVILTFPQKGSFKQFEPSLSETFGYCLAGTVNIQFGQKSHQLKAGEALYFQASQPHRIYSDSDTKSVIVLVATDSYL